MNKKKYIDEEAFVVENSGEIPEVTLHEALYHLTKDPDGPSLSLDAKDVLPLKQAVVERYRVIILRDLDPENRDKSVYRGLARCAANWLRLEKFCLQENLDFKTIQYEAAIALRKFLDNESRDVQNGSRSSCINCSHKEIESLVHSLGLSLSDLPKGWLELCPPA